MPLITAQEIITQARTWLGTKYHHQGRLKKSAKGQGGVDCIGLIIGVCKELGIQDGKGTLISDYDETGYALYPEGKRLELAILNHLRLIPAEKMCEGDVLLFRVFKEPQHVGLVTNYPGGGFGILHCHSRSGAVVEHVFAEPWHRMMVGVYRFKRKQLVRIP